VPLPAGVEASFAQDRITIKGPKGSLAQWINPAVSVEIAAGKEIRFTRSSDEPTQRALHGLYRALCRNMVEGVVKGYRKRIEIHGVGYQAAIQGNKISMNVGFSNPVVLEIPKGLTLECPNNTTVDIIGFDKQLVGQFSARLRGIRPSEPYKGKGIRYAGEQIRRKAGKSVAGGSK